MDIGTAISRGIKEGKWLNIQYKQENEITYFWAAIKSINIDKKVFGVSIFNDKKGLDVLQDTHIKFDKILSAEVIDFSTYDVPEQLITHIEDNIEKLEWLNYDRFNNNVLNYYKECSVLDNDPFQKEHFIVEGIDVNVLMKQKFFSLNEKQERYIIEKIYKYNIHNKDAKYYDLAISKAAISINKKKYIICYYDVVFNPEKKWLQIDKHLKFNKSFLINGRKVSLFNYIDMDVDEFIKDFDKLYSEKREYIRSHLKYGELYDEMPELMLLERDMSVDLSATYNQIEYDYFNDLLETPLKSFFGNITKRNNLRRKEPSIVIYDKRININQMRVIYNALKYPVTYVQGPPGTGKTQTILNVVLSAFLEGKTVLVCSSNNKPVDGIVEKLQFEYRGKKILFPFLRLGKFSDVIDATKKIKELYDFRTNDVVKENLIDKIVTTNNNDHAKLLKLLEIQEKRVSNEDYIESCEKLLNSLQDSNSAIADNLKQRVQQFKEELKNLPVITNDELVGLFTSVKDNFKLQQFLYYKSLSYIQKLHEPKYEELIKICNIESDDERALEFNKWCSIDKNMKMLNNVFPIICSTNISAVRLGNTSYKFDLVIMDEAGQCNVAHALIPISKARNLLMVGDPNQLRPVILLDDYVNEELMSKYNVIDTYNYKKYSILDVMRNHDNISKYILIKYHYRCGKKIIRFSNQRYYNSSLDLSYIDNEGEVKFMNVKNLNIKERNSAYEEAIEIIKYIKRNNISDATIITPFVNQQNLISALLEQNGLNNINCGTIHSLQGAEKDTIILSTALSIKTHKNTYNWLKNNFELLNVGTTRAKNKLIITGDLDVINALSDKKDDLYNLIQYAISDGNIIVPPNDSIKIEIGKSNGSENESIFFKTLSHFCSTHKHFDCEKNVSLKNLFKDDPILKHSKKEFDFVLYETQMFKPKKPVIVIELNGGEHFGNRNREKSDVYKMKVCKEHNISFLIIDNSFIKSYEYIRDLLNTVKSKKVMQLTLNELLGLEN